MTIAMTIVTTTAQILDTNQVNGFGTVTITPSQAFTYYDGAATISISNSSTVINVTDGQLDSALVLAPTSGATNAPEVYYIVDIRVNGTYDRILWSLPSPASTTEFNDVARVASGSSVNDEVAALLQATDPFKQYLLRSDSKDVKTAGAVSDGRGAIPRAGTISGYLDKSFYLNVAGPDDSALTASNIPIVDSGGYYPGNENVEDALGVAGLDIDTNTTDIATNTALVATALQNVAGNGYVYGVGTNSSAMTTSYGTILTITLPSTGRWIIYGRHDFLTGAAGQVKITNQLAQGTASPSLSRTSQLFVSNSASNTMEASVIADYTCTTAGTVVLRTKQTSPVTAACTNQNQDIIAIKIAV